MATICGSLISRAAPGAGRRLRSAVWKRLWRRCVRRSLIATAPRMPNSEPALAKHYIALETARMWVHRAALLGEASEGDAGDIANTVNLTRIAVETAGLDIIRLVQRSLGLTAFRAGTLTELLFRDLATYLRQPAPDIVLDEAAAHFTTRDLPMLVWPAIPP